MASSVDWIRFANETYNPEYIVLDNQHAAFIENYAERSMKLRGDCHHPLFNFIKDSTNPYEGGSTWDCQCVNCGKVKCERPTYYKGKLIMGELCMGYAKQSDFSYKEIYQTFHGLKDNGMEEQAAVEKVLIQYKHQPKVKQL